MIRRWQARERARLRRALNDPAASEWENLGLWSRADQPYADAARALAMRVGDAAALKRGARVLDIGPGVGLDQKNLWRDTYAIGDWYGWERATPPPDAASWDHVLAVDSAYFVPGLNERWARLWPQVVAGGSITWTDLYLARHAERWRDRWQLAVTSALTGIPRQHWQTANHRLGVLGTLSKCTVSFEDLTDEVLGGFVRHMQWRRKAGRPDPRLRMAYATAALLRPLLEKDRIGYGLFQVRNA